MLDLLLSSCVNVRLLNQVVKLWCWLSQGVSCIGGKTSVSTEEITCFVAKMLNLEQIIISAIHLIQNMLQIYQTSL